LVNITTQGESIGRAKTRSDDLFVYFDSEADRM